jgi:aminopeptidase N
MSTYDARRIRREDYRPPACWIDSVELDVRIHPEETRVRSRLEVRRNRDVPREPLVLDGVELELRGVFIGERELASTEYELGPETLTLRDIPERFELETEVAIRPETNTRLMGLYRSGPNYCTQCEAEGFRRITYFLDRPDVMARYAVRIEADRERFPVLLSNGNRDGEGSLPDGFHWARWKDPFKKPSYLFALVAGDLVCRRRTFRTRSGRDVALEVWVEPRNEPRCEHALASLEHAARWDEEVFGRELDLDVYMIVAVDDFNMGAMENKGLNLFNSRYVLADPATATDDDYEAIEGVVAHEYFHNWTGNRVTCRDWFQLTLKEGLTVYRDQLFSADRTSEPVKRIADVRRLRTAQFAEDSGPMAHPIRPEAYVEVNNFYTATVYEKGAEVVRMYEALLGTRGFRAGMDLYFERHDGSAVTCDDFRAALAEANGVDLGQFGRWYSQAGTPTLRARGEYDERARSYRLVLAQSSPRIEGANEPLPLHVPVRMGFLGRDGRDLPLRMASDGDAPATRLLELREPEQAFTFLDVPEKPVPSLLRGFSAPVKLELERSDGELAFLMAHDSDPFQRWDAGQTLATRVLLGLIADHGAGRGLVLDRGFVSAFARVLEAPALDGSLKALALTLPSEDFLGQQLAEIDPDAVHVARRFAVRELARELRSALVVAYERNRSHGPYSNDKHSIDRRRLKNRALAYLIALDEPDVRRIASRQLAEADNMTDSEAALACLVESEGPEREPALEDFYVRWQEEPLVLDKWFRLQATSSLAPALERVQALARHPAFTLKNPNRVRALLGAFAFGNLVHFHRPDGAAYAFYADQLLALDALNPQVAARLVSAFNSWKRYEPVRRTAMRREIERIAAHPGLSKDVGEIVGRARER